MADHQDVDPRPLIDSIICKWSLDFEVALTERQLNGLVDRLANHTSERRQFSVECRESYDKLSPFVLVHFIGDEEGVTYQAFEDYKKQYPVQGYKTKMKRIPALEADGKWHAFVERYSSCD